MSKRKNQVSRDFQATLQTFIRSPSIEDNNSNIVNQTVEDCYLSIEEKRNSTNSSERRNTLKSSSKDELVGDQPVDSVINKDTIPSDDSAEKKMSLLSPKISERSFESTVKRKSKYLQRFFYSNTYSKLPFERTTFSSLPYHLNIDTEHKDTLSVQVTEFYTINKIKSKISRKSSLNIEKLALFYNNERLEGDCTLYSYKINSSCRIQMKVIDPITIIGLFDSKKIRCTLYTSATVMITKMKLGKMFNLNPINVELRFKDLVLEKHKELFVYNVLNDSQIEIVEVQHSDVSLESQGNKLVDQFHQMTNNLTKCKCYQLKIDVMARLFYLMLNFPSYTIEIQKNRQILKEFDEKRHFHHMLCFKIQRDRDSSQCSSVSDMISMSDSGSDSSLKSAVFEESKRVDKHDSLKIEPPYIKLIAESTEFKVFKHLLRDKIGTKCNLLSVALLYQYTKDTVRYIGFDENETSPDVTKILDFTKLYFEKYFMKHIIDKGGLVALTLSVTDVD